jgi:RimJ/RimL family protein N-acetyltransferase
MSFSPGLPKKDSEPQPSGGEQELATNAMQNTTPSLPDRVHTARLTLRPFSLGDIDDIMLYATDERWSKFLPVPQPYKRADGIAFLELQAKVDTALSPCWAIEYEGKVVGGINIKFEPGFARGVLGYSIAPAVWGKGLTTEAARKIVGLSFESFSQLAEIAADANSLNVASLKVMEKLGMRRVGVSQQQRSGHEGLVDVVTCSLSRAAWLASEAQSAEE